MAKPYEFSTYSADETAEAFVKKLHQQGITLEQARKVITCLNEAIIDIDMPHEDFEYLLEDAGQLIDDTLGTQ